MPSRWTFYAAPVFRYRDEKGRFVSQATVWAWGEDSMDYNASATVPLAEQVATQAIDVGQWQQQMREAIKAEYIRQYELGIGGRSNMTSRDWGSIGGMVGEQYRWLDQFADQIAAGELSEAQIAARSAMYILSAREAYERANARVHAGAIAVRWDVNESAENCPDCLAFGDLGWQDPEDDPFGDCFPGSGCTQCLTRCRCRQEYKY